MMLVEYPCGMDCAAVDEMLLKYQNAKMLITIRVNLGLGSVGVGTFNMMTIFAVLLAILVKKFARELRRRCRRICC